MKRYSNINVYDAAKKRIEYIFDEFETIAVSFSGGKDSGVVLNMAVDEARKSGKRFTAIFIDLEAFYKVTIEYVEKMFSNNRDVLDPLWICLPMESPNALSYFSPTWTWWEEGKEDIWVREMPKNEWVINLSNHKFEFYKPGMSFEKFTPLLNEWLAKTGSAAILLGLRAEESLNRYRAINDNKSTYKGLQWSTQINKAYSFSPIYDWTVEDIWTYNGKFRKEYNKLYDLFY
ncbi:phosphoadenosine phosphosulfate reductase family protein, partial [Veillonella sp.]